MFLYNIIIKVIELLFGGMKNEEAQNKKKKKIYVKHDIINGYFVFYDINCFGCNE